MVKPTIFVIAPDGRIVICDDIVTNDRSRTPHGDWTLLTITNATLCHRNAPHDKDLARRDIVTAARRPLLSVCAARSATHPRPVLPPVTTQDGVLGNKEQDSDLAVLQAAHQAAPALHRRNCCRAVRPGNNDPT